LTAAAMICVACAFTVPLGTVRAHLGPATSKTG
jgi:hypothetical protein